MPEGGGHIHWFGSELCSGRRSEIQEQFACKVEGPLIKSVMSLTVRARKMRNIPSQTEALTRLRDLPALLIPSMFVSRAKYLRILPEVFWWGRSGPGIRPRLDWVNIFSLIFMLIVDTFLIRNVSRVLK